MGVLRAILEVFLILLTLATIYLLAQPVKTDLRSYINSIGDPQMRDLVYGTGYVVYKLGYYSFSLLKLIFNMIISLTSWVISAIR